MRGFFFLLLPALLLSSGISMPDSFSVDFIQKVKKHGKVKHEYEGVLTYRAPNLLRWDYPFPEERSVCYDGKKIINLDYRLEQASFYQGKSINFKRLLKKARKVPGKPHLYTVKAGTRSFTLQERRGRLAQVAFYDFDDPETVILLRFSNLREPENNARCPIPKSFDLIRE